MSFPTVSIPILGSIPVVLIHPSIPNVIGQVSPTDQREIAGHLENFIEEVKADGSTSHLVRLGVLGPNNMNEADFKKDHLLEKCYWQLAQVYRSSTPSRIAEAIPAVTFVLDVFTRMNPGQQDVTPMLYLGIALSKNRGKEDEAVKALRDALDVADRTERSWKNALWGRAHLSRLLRRMDQTDEADRQEMLIRRWLLGHPYGLPPSEFKELVSDETETDPGVNRILEHPEVKEALGHVIFEDRGAGVAMFVTNQVAVKKDVLIQ